MTDANRSPHLSSTHTPPSHEWLEELFREHYVELCAFVYGYVASDDAAEDVVQDIFLSIWKDPARWTERADKLRILLYVAARNRALDHLRYRQVRERHARRATGADLPNPFPAADIALAQQEIEVALNSAIAELPGSARQIFLLNREEGLTYREIAERLGISIKTVETQMSRSLKKLRSSMAEYLILLIAALLG